jgi:hypothetical protein
MGSILPGAGSGFIAWDSPDAVNAFEVSTFTIGCDYVVLPQNCDARIFPSQINAIVSEMIALMQCFDPDGTFDCDSVNNLCTTFTVYADDVASTLTNLDSRVSVLEGSGVLANPYAYTTGVLGVQSITQNTLTVVTDWVAPIISDANITYSTGRFTVVLPGMYSISGWVQTGTPTLSNRVGIYVNGNVVGQIYHRTDSNALQVGSVAVVIPLAASDYVELKFEGDSAGGGAYNFSLGRFAMYRLGSL